MSYGFQVMLAFKDLQNCEVDSGNLNIAGGQEYSDPVSIACGKWMGEDSPASIHLEVGVDAGPSDANKKMLATANYLVDDGAGEIDSGVARHPDIAAGEYLAFEYLA